ncbi:MAG: hypothetical protein K2Q34_06460 [Alphaproteobacteria bacterium]|nr:hypothetical protein [Alphaproteobacteria bacterium]
MIRVAAAQYKFEILPSIEDVAEKLEQTCRDARNGGADLLLLPEYAGMEWIWPHGKSFKENVQDFQKNGFQFYLENVAQLAIKYQLILIAGSLPVLENKAYYNRTYIANPKGELFWQDKIYLTPSELALGVLKGGDTLKLFKANFGTFAVCVCYDSEFPELVNKAIFNGVDILLIPSYTDSPHGANRVQVAARCRAMENQCFSINAVALGKVDCDEFCDLALGAAAIYTPIDIGFPEDGILANDLSSTHNLIFADLDLDAMSMTRLKGQVRNYEDRSNLKQTIIEKVEL